MQATAIALFLNLNFKYQNVTPRRSQCSKLHCSLDTRKAKFRGTSGIPDCISSSCKHRSFPDNPLLLNEYVKQQLMCCIESKMLLLERKKFKGRNKCWAGRRDKRRDSLWKELRTGRRIEQSDGGKQVRSGQKSSFWNTVQWVLVWNGRDEKQRLLRLFRNNKSELRIKSRTWPWEKQSLLEHEITVNPHGMICSLKNHPWYVQETCLEYKLE